VALADAIEATLGGAAGKTTSVAYRNEPYGEGLAKEFAAAWQAKGGKVLGPIAFDPKQAVFDSEAAQIVEGNPDAYMIVDYPDSYVKMGAALLRTGKFDANRLPKTYPAPPKTLKQLQDLETRLRSYGEVLDAATELRAE
jgi:branched-chain amino acid transport system substrate-binding protein